MAETALLQRVTQLENALAERHEALQRLAVQTPAPATDPDRVAAALRALPVFPERLSDLPHSEMRTLLEACNSRQPMTPVSGC